MAVRQPGVNPSGHCARATRLQPELGRAQKSRGYHACEGAILGTGNRNLRRDCASPGSVSHYHHSPSSLAASYPRLFSALLHREALRQAVQAPAPNGVSFSREGEVGWFFRALGGLLGESRLERAAAGSSFSRAAAAARRTSATLSLRAATRAGTAS